MYASSQVVSGSRSGLGHIAVSIYTRTGELLRHEQHVLRHLNIDGARRNVRQEEQNTSSNSGVITAYMPVNMEVDTTVI